MLVKKWRLLRLLCPICPICEDHEGSLNTDTVPVDDGLSK